MIWTLESQQLLQRIGQDQMPLFILLLFQYYDALLDIKKSTFVGSKIILRRILLH